MGRSNTVLEKKSGNALRNKNNNESHMYSLGRISIEYLSDGFIGLLIKSLNSICRYIGIGFFTGQVNVDRFTNVYIHVRH